MVNEQKVQMASTPTKMQLQTWGYFDTYLTMSITTKTSSHGQLQIDRQNIIFFRTYSELCDSGIYLGIYFTSVFT